MKNILKIALFTADLLFVSCKEEIEKPKVSYEKPSKNTTKIKTDTTQITVADLPINIEGTKYLLFPIGDLNIYGSNSKSLYSSSSSDSDVRFTMSNYNDFQLTGYLQNLKFQEIGKDSITTLTKKQVLIQTVTYLKSIADKNKQQYLVYTLADMDTNKDDKLDTNDIKSLYISEISGNNFVKLSTDFQELLDWNLIELSNKLYFRTIEDINKNGEFDKKDVVHYYFVNLLEKELKSIEFKPV